MQISFVVPALAVIAKAQNHQPAYAAAHERRVLAECITEADYTSTTSIIIAGESPQAYSDGDAEHTNDARPAQATPETGNPNPTPAPESQTNSQPKPEPQPSLSQEEPGESLDHVSGGFYGDMTYYDVGLGACGFDDSGKGDSEFIVALPQAVMGEQSNDSPRCDKKVRITAASGAMATATATVRDKCMGCAAGDIDGSRALFVALFGELTSGRVPVYWSFD